MRKTTRIGIIGLIILFLPLFIEPSHGGAIRDWFKKRRGDRREQKRDRSEEPVGVGGFNVKGHKEQIIYHDGIKRRYVVYTPSSYNGSEAMAVILNLHGGGGDIGATYKQTQMHVTAEKEGFIVVYPEGTGRKLGKKLIATWNAGRCCGTAQRDKIDDVGYFNTLLDDLESKYNVDTNRIYSTGHSNGSMMSYRLACELSDRIAAIAPNSGQDAFDNCRPTRAVSVIHFHGTADQSAKYNGGHCGGRAGDEGWKCSSVPDYIEEWRVLNGCASVPRTTLQKGDATCITYDSCRSNTEVTLCTLEGAGHTWPGGYYALNFKGWKKRVGEINRDISANDMMWEFFQKHTLR